MTAQWTAIVLYYRHGPDTARTIEDLVNQSVSPKSIILVDNDSNDGVCAKIVSENPQATLLSLPRNMGYAAAMNLAAHQAEDSEWLLFATHEVRLSADAVERLLRAGEDPKTVQLAPMLGALDGSEVWSSGGTLSRLGRPAHAKVAGSESQEVTWVDGACHLVRASAFWDVAGFDESFFLYWEDIDLSVRLAARGSIRVVPDARGRQSTSKTPVYFGTRNSVRMWRKHRRPAAIVFAVLRALAKTVRDDLGDGPEGRVRRSARRAGIKDGFSGALRLDYVGVRERVR